MRILKGRVRDVVSWDKNYSWGCGGYKDYWGYGYGCSSGRGWGSGRDWDNGSSDFSFDCYLEFAQYYQG